MYDLKQIFRQKPNTIQNAVVILLATVVGLVDEIRLSDTDVTLIGAAVIVLLNLFYVDPMTVSRSGLEEVERAVAAKPQRPVRKARV